MPPTTLQSISNPYLKEYVICSMSYLAFVVRHCFIIERFTKEIIKFILWEGQRIVVPLFISSTRLIALKSRQIGITWLTATYVLWKAIFHRNEFIVIISEKEDLAIEFLDRVKFVFDHLPGYLKPKVLKRTNTELSFGYEEKDAAGNTVLKGLNSIIKSLPSTPEAGQSKTITLLIMDETALNRYNKEIWSAAAPTLEHSHGQVIIISNPTKNGEGWPWTRKLYTDTMKGLTKFHRIFLSWKVVPGRITDPDHPKYFLKLVKEEGLDDNDLSMQYPTTEEEAISSLSGGYFGGVVLRFKPLNGIIGNLYVTDKKIVFDKSRKGILEIWRWPKSGWHNRYCIGSDVGEGLGGNFSVAYVFDRHTMEFVARLRSNQVEADKWGNPLLFHLAMYYQKGKIGVERNGPGISTVGPLSKVYNNLFTMRREGRTKGSYTNIIGWLTTDESKQVLASNLKKYFRDEAPYVPCPYLLDECSSFVVKDGGKIEAEQGAFDDCVMAAGIALQVSKSMGACVNMEEEKDDKGWRELLWGDKDTRLKAYDVATM